MAMVLAQPVMCSPSVCTPAIFQQPMPPWALQTPESSPMLWGCAPAGEYLYGEPEPSGSSPGGICKDFLRTICEPYFDQMLAAVQQALQADTEARSQCEASNPLPPVAKRSQAAAPASVGQPCQATREPSTEDGSDASECGAFSSIFSAPSSTVNEEEHGKGRHSASRRGGELAKVPQAGAGGAGQGYKAPESDAEQESDQEEKTVMVCRHWKSKGWCRMGTNCKFLHPEHKRGIGLVAANQGGTTSGVNHADASGCNGFGSNPSHQVACLAADGKVKSGRNRKSKAKAVVTQIPGHIFNAQPGGQIMAQGLGSQLIGPVA